MLCSLSIKNLVLVESCAISFHEGFTILTGESGAGKSVVASAILLLLGQKQDSGQIRKGAESAVVEGTFDPLASPILDLLQEAGITQEPDEALIIRRELFATGKSKSFVNNQAVTAGFLKKLAPFLVHFCSQHAHMELFDSFYVLNELDHFAGLQALKKEYHGLYTNRVAIQKEIQNILNSKKDREALVAIASHQIDEIEAIGLQAGEDEALYARFSELTTQIEHTDTIQNVLHELENAVLPPFTRLKSHFEKLPTLCESYKTIAAELKELTYELTKSHHNPEEVQDELQTLQTRLTEIDGLKKKFGKTIEEVLAFKKEREQLLKELGEQDILLHELQEKEKELSQQEETLAKQLSAKRKKQAPILGKRITDELRALNMPSSLFEVELVPSPRGPQGDEAVACYIQVNKGLARARVEDAASGGELSRIILAFTCVLIRDDDPICLIFDEIDANIGGETAAIAGKKLHSLSRGRQVLAISHFPQVAACADHHFVIAKHEKKGSTFTTITPLSSESDRETEFARMVGGKGH